MKINKKKTTVTKKSNHYGPFSEKHVYKRILPVKAVYRKNLTLSVQVGALFATLRFQRPDRRGIKTARGREACIPTAKVRAP